jgi:hypothetical protein
MSFVTTRDRNLLRGRRVDVEQSPTREARNQLQEMTYGQSDEPQSKLAGSRQGAGAAGRRSRHRARGETTSLGDTEEDEDRLREGLEDEATDDDE